MRHRVQLFRIVPLALFLMATPAFAQLVGRIEIRNNTGQQLSFRISGANDSQVVRLASGYVQYYNDSRALTFEIATTRGDVRIANVRYRLVPGHAFELVDRNGVWDLTDKGESFATRPAPGLVRFADGSFHPVAGYEWTNPDAPDNFDVKLRADLRVATYGADGIGVSFVPAPGYVWNGDPNQLRTRVQPGLRLVGVDSGGRATFVPAPGYVWSGWNGDPSANNFAVTVRSDLRVLVYDADGIGVIFEPAPGRRWAGDPSTLVTVASNADDRGETRAKSGRESAPPDRPGR